jgi:hypothetical protein
VRRHRTSRDPRRTTPTSATAGSLRTCDRRTAMTHGDVNADRPDARDRRASSVSFETTDRPGGFDVPTTCGADDMSFSARATTGWPFVRSGSSRRRTSRRIRRRDRAEASTTARLRSSDADRRLGRCATRTKEQTAPCSCSFDQFETMCRVFRCLVGVKSKCLMH